MEQMQGRGEKSLVVSPGKLSQPKFTYIIPNSAFIYTHTTLINYKKKQSSKQGTKNKFYSQSEILSLSVKARISLVIAVPNGWCFNSSTEDSAEHNCREAQAGAANTCVRLEI